MYRLCCRSRSMVNVNRSSNTRICRANNSNFRSKRRDDVLNRNEVDLSTNDLQAKVLKWDAQLPIPNPPSESSLLDHLVRRRIPSSASRIRVGLNKLLVRSACRALGLKNAHQRLSHQHSKDPVANCWYAPANHGDTFGIRHDEIYFHENIIPSQPVTSYAVLVRGSAKDPGTWVDGGIAERTKSLDENRMERNTDSMINRASSLIKGLMRARAFYLSSEITQDKIKKTPLSMQWYNYIFSCSMQFYPGSIERFKAPDWSSKHIIVMVRGNMYKVDLIDYDENGGERNISEQQLKNQLHDIITMETSGKSSTPISVLTTLASSERCREEQILKTISQQNIHNLSLLRDALFVVALDPKEPPRTANEAMFALYSGNFMNRWYDKSVQLVVFGNGVAGFVNNYLAGMTGTVGTNFVRIAVGNEEFGDQTHEMDDVTNWPDPVSLRWVDTNDGYFQQKIATIIKDSRTSGPFKPLTQDVFRICDGFSFEAVCKGIHVTPGAAFQAGFQLALAKAAGRCMSVNEVVSIRHFRFGGMTFMDSSLADMKLFINTALQSKQDVQNLNPQELPLLKSLLLKATDSYRNEVFRYKKGEVNLWHLDSLYRILGLPNRLPFRNTPQEKLNTKLKKSFIHFLRSPLVNLLPAQVPENVTSNPSWFPEIESIGRPGVKCILPPTSMALHYMFGKDAIAITVNANSQHPCYKREEEFVKELECSLLFIKDLLQSNNELQKQDIQGSI